MRFFAILTPGYCDHEGDDEEPLFERAVGKLVPPGQRRDVRVRTRLGRGLYATLSHLAKRKIRAHLHLVAQLGKREILDRQALTRKAFGWT